MHLCPSLDMIACCPNYLPLTMSNNHIDKVNKKKDAVCMYIQILVRTF